MARNVKCHWCNVTDTPKDEMEYEMVGEAKPVRKNYHKDCYQKYLEHKEFLAKELIEKNALNEVIKDIYGVTELPSQAWMFLEKLRFGNPVFQNQQTGKRYREGYEYSLIKATFEYCSDTIEYYNRTKDFNGFMGAFRYALTIIIDKIYYVEQRENERKARESISKRKEEVQNHDNENLVFNAQNGKREDEMDISDLLD